MHDGLRRLVQHLNFLYKSEPAFSEDDDSYAGFEWIDFHDADDSIFTFLRKAESDSTLLFAVNAKPVPRHTYRVGAPGAGWYEEVLNTDAGIYGGGVNAIRNTTISASRARYTILAKRLSNLNLTKIRIRIINNC